MAGLASSEPPELSKSAFSRFPRCRRLHLVFQESAFQRYRRLHFEFNLGQGSARSAELTLGQGSPIAGGSGEIQPWSGIRNSTSVRDQGSGESGREFNLGEGSGNSTSVRDRQGSRKFNLGRGSGISGNSTSVRDRQNSTSVRDRGIGGNLGRGSARIAKFNLGRGSGDRRKFNLGRGSGELNSTSVRDRQNSTSVRDRGVVPTGS
jgi:hypothetical protein